MRWRLLACRAIPLWRRLTNFRLRFSLPAVTLLAALVQGCATPLPSVSAGPDPSDPHAPAPRVSYRSTIGSYTSMRPVEPAAWQKQNEQVAPAAKPMQHGGM
jgi:hypothetical protein